MGKPYVCMNENLYITSTDRNILQNTNLPAKTKVCLKRSRFPVPSNYDFTGFTVPCLINPSKMESVNKRKITLTLRNTLLQVYLLSRKSLLNRETCFVFGFWRFRLHIF